MKPDEEQPEMQFAEGFVQHSAGDFRVPKIKCSKKRKHDPAHDHIVKVRDDKVRTVKLPIERRRAQHDASETGNQELEQESDAEKHGCRELDLATPHSAEPDEDLDASRNSNNHRRQHE